MMTGFFEKVLKAAVIAILGTGISMAMASNKWRLQVSGGADSDGVISLKFVSSEDLMFNVDVMVPDGTGENHVARIIRDTLREELPKDLFHIEVDDGEDVLIKKRHFEHNFELEVMGNTVDGVHLSPDRE